MTQVKGFNGLRVASFESRKALEMVQLIADSGGDPLVTPCLREIPLSENVQALTFGKKLFNDEVDILILLTGIGTQILLNVLETVYPLDEIIEQFRKISLVARGPKPQAVLKGVGLKAHLVVPEPSTWRGILQVLDAEKPIRGLRVVVQEYGTSNQNLLNGLKERGAEVMSVPVYRWALPEDTAPLRMALETVIKGEVDVLIFTNSNQIVNVMRVAKEHGLEDSFRTALKRAVVASVGPNTTEFLDEYGLPVDIEPARNEMSLLVKQASEQSLTILEQKRFSEIEVVDRSRSFEREEGRRVDFEDTLFMRACCRKPVSHTPIWLMRQAGRYLKSYRDLRDRVSFVELCKNSDLAAEITVEAVKQLGVDAAILFSDILVVLEPMGLEVEYGKDEGPLVHFPLRRSSDVDRLLEVDPRDSLAFVFETIRKVRRWLPSHIPLIGFAGAPFTLASYMIEGQSSRNFIHTKTFMHLDPKAWDELMNKISDMLILFLNEQINAGVQSIQLFDSWVGCLSVHDFRKFALPYSKRVFSAVQSSVPKIYFGTQTSELLEAMQETGIDVLGLDWRVDLDKAWRRLGEIAVQGNLDPAVLLTDPLTVRREAERILNQAKGKPGHIFNLGHGVLPGTSADLVRLLVNIVHDFR